MTPLLLNEIDDVLILVERQASGSVAISGGATLDSGLSAGHKIARHAIQQGSEIKKYGQTIGFASEDIAKGAHVHSHNCQFGAHTQDGAFGKQLDAAKAAIPPRTSRTFLGYKRADGRVGTRNMVALVATVNCSATVIRKAAAEIERLGMLDEFPNIDGVVALAHGTGCGMASEGPGWDNLQRVLWGHATHPNVGGAIFVGLGCEIMQIARMKSVFESSGKERFHGLTIQANGGTTATIQSIIDEVRQLLPQINETKRTPVSAAHLTVALQCGGSDAMSGITANPALGVASDLIVGEGGAVILAETPEIYGAEQLLLNRVAQTDVGDSLVERLRWWEEYTRINNGSLDNNPSPGNKAGGLTTILEKSLGAVAKAGSTPLNEVINYGAIPHGKGLIFMDSPGYDPVSVTGQIASGAQIVVFTTGRGSAFGSKPAPTIKLATNDVVFQSMSEDMDLNCGDCLSSGVPLRDKGSEILDLILAVASGQESKSESLGLGDHEFLPWQIGAVM